MRKPKTIWFVYLLECKNGRIYTGITTDLKKRFTRHCAGKGAKFTQRNPPSHIIASKKCRSGTEARKLEYMVKKLKPIKKRALGAQWSSLK